MSTLRHFHFISQSVPGNLSYHLHFLIVISLLVRPFLPSTKSLDSKSYLSHKYLHYFCESFAFNKSFEGSSLHLKEISHFAFGLRYMLYKFVLLPLLLVFLGFQRRPNRVPWGQPARTPPLRCLGFYMAIGSLGIACELIIRQNLAVTDGTFWTDSSTFPRVR